MTAMDQHREVLAFDGRLGTRLDPQAGIAQAQNSLAQLHRLVNRPQVMKPQYQELIERAQRNLQQAIDLNQEIDAFVILLELPRIPGGRLASGSAETTTQPQPPALPPE
jgi:hypothetical protein